jgi:dTDP-4-dehydrorhamnose reductase
MLANASGFVNVASRGYCSWHDFASAIVAAVKPGIPIAKLTTTELNFPALRPAFSALDTSRFTKLTGRQMPTWQEGLAAYLTLEPLAEQVRALKT